MATTKIKALKNTLNKALHYITNPNKTDGSLLVSSFGCSVEFADLEMQATAIKEDRRSKRIAYHMIQSFAPDDPLTPEQAHAIGKEFADKVTNGKYEYVIATHIDKGHIHNHIIFNATSFGDHKKYRYSGVKEKNRIRGISDKLCRENNLSVIEKDSGTRGKAKFEYEQSKQGLSWKDKLKKAIDETVVKSNSFEEFLLEMEMEYGYEIKHGKHIAFKAPEQERFIRMKRLGEMYTEENVRNRISSQNQKTVPIHKSANQNILQSKKEKKKSKRINLIVDISKNIKAQTSKGYEISLQRSNTENLIKTMNFLMDHGITTPDKFLAYAEPVREEYQKMRSESKTLDESLRNVTEQIKYVQLYQKYKPLFLAYERSTDKNEFLIKYGNEIALYRASLIYFKKNDITNPQSINLSKLFEMRKEIKTQIFTFDEKFKKVKTELNELNTVQKNIEMTLDIKLSDSVETVNSAPQKKDEKTK